MFNTFHTHHFSLVLIATLCFAAFLGGCGGSSDSNEKKSSEHHDNDHATPNSDGTTHVTLGNVSFTTKQYKFADDGHAQATALTTSNPQVHSIGKKIKRFGIDGDSIHAYVEKSALDSEVISFSLATNTQTATKKADSRVSGFSYNGVILISDGAEDLNFYHVSNKKVSDNFFHVSKFNGSKFISEVFLDHDRVYVYDATDILSFSIHQSGDIKKVMKVDAFSQIRFTADSSYVYLSASDLTDTKIYRIKKSDQSHELWFTLPNWNATAISVDSNHLYIAGYDAKTSSHASAKTVVHKKSTHAYLTEISTPYAEDIKVHEGKIYDFNSSTHILTIRDLDFTP